MALTKAERLARARQYRSLRRARRSAPGMLVRIGDASLPDSELSPVERACRQLRDSIYEQVGGRERLLPTQAMRVDVLLFKHLVVSGGQADVLPLIERHGLMSLRTLKMHPAVVDLDRLLTSYEKTLEAVGQIKPAEPKEQTLESIMAEYARGEAPGQRREPQAPQADQEPRDAIGAAEGPKVCAWREPREQAGQERVPAEVVVTPQTLMPGRAGYLVAEPGPEIGF